MASEAIREGPKSICIRGFGWGHGESNRNRKIRLYEVNLCDSSSSESSKKRKRGHDSPQSVPMLDPLCKTNHPVASCCVSLGSTIYCIGAVASCSIALGSTMYSVGANPDDLFGFGCEFIVTDSRLSNQIWKQASPMLNGRWFPHAVAMAGKIYVFGGCRANTDVWAEVYHPEKDEWKALMKPPPSSKITQLPYHNFFAATLDIDSQQILVGSCTGDHLYVYNTTSDSWETKKHPGLCMMSGYTKPVLHRNTLYWLDYRKIHAYDLNAKQSFCGHFDCKEVDDLLDELEGLDYMPLFFHFCQEEFCLLWTDTVVHPSSSRPHRMCSNIHWVKWRISKNMIKGSLSISIISKDAVFVKHQLTYIDSVMLKG
uniref:F-box/kelch-repeat protein n=1 Tax=Davidia involucrata TaxID=16924 RepID=A0A5B6YXR0_DAVIN